MGRKPPRSHRVNSHTRNGRRVSEYRRGSGNVPRQRKVRRQYPKRRKPPKTHQVQKHTRSGYRVKSYRRG